MVKSLDLDINRTVKEFARLFKTRLVQTHPVEARRALNTTKKTKAKTELPLFTLPDGFEKTKTLNESALPGYLEAVL